MTVWASRQLLVFGHGATNVKSTEITAISLLLERLQLTRALVTIDAMRTQETINASNVRRGGDYLLALTANWPPLYADVVGFLEDPPADMIAVPHEPTMGIEKRRHVVCHDVPWIWSDRRYPDGPRFFHLAMIETTVASCGKTANGRCVYLCPAKRDAKTFVAAIRAHQHVENRLHWVLDVLLNDNLARLRTGAGRQAMAVVKHKAMTLGWAPDNKHRFKVRRKLVNLNPDYLEKLLRAGMDVSLKR